MRALIKENIERYRAKNPGLKMDMKILTALVFNGYTRNRYEVIRRYNNGKNLSYKIKYIAAICKVLECEVQDLIKYES